MKLTIPTVKISKDEGFSTENDIFLRKEFGEELAKLIEQSEGNIVIALDAKWGEGKSTFINMWRGYIRGEREEKIRSIYFDAFANDYQKDPFLTLTAEIYELIKDESEERKEEFKRKAGNAIKSMARGAIKIGVRAGSGGLLDGSIVDSVESDVSKLLADQVDQLIASRLENTVKDKLAISHFREHLEELATKEENPIVFIIDELDRCRPDFSLELLEQIKHLFSVPSITFLLVLNRIQLEEAIKSTYGSGLNASLYLQKFINLWLKLPRKSDQYQDNGKQYVHHLFTQMLDDGEAYKNQDAVELLLELVSYLKPSFREIEQILTYFAIIQNMQKGTGYYFHVQSMIAFICFIKVSNSDLFEQINVGNLSIDEVYEKAGLSLIAKENDNTRYTHIKYLLTTIKFDFSDQDTKNKMLQEKEVSFNEGSSFGREPQVLTLKICRWLSEMSIN